MVNFATIHIKNGDLQKLVDGFIMETYNDVAGNGRDSIANVAGLAMQCLHHQPKARPSMHEVWKELQSMWLALHGGTLVDLASIIADEEHSLRDHKILLSNSVSRSNNDSSDFSLGSDTSDVELSQFSPPTE